jgi:thiamine pyrophosphate-dependent acetolactate synthase large subunit-like protein
VLLWVPDRRREAHLLRLLTGVAMAMPVATAVHSATPYGPVWALPGDAGRRRHLHELPVGRPRNPAGVLADPDQDW